MGSTTPDQVAVASIGGLGWQGPADDPAYRALKSSVRASGVLEPLHLRPVEGGLELVSGARRLRAARETGLLSVLALILEPGHPAAAPPSPAPVVPDPPAAGARPSRRWPPPPRSGSSPTRRRPPPRHPPRPGGPGSAGPG